MKNKVALVLEGGGLRGIFTAGVIDCFLDNDVSFDYVVGVSCGSCNAFAYMAKSKGFMKNCTLQSDDSFFGVKTFVETRKFVDLNKIFYDYTKRYHFDFDTFKKTKVKWEFVATNLKTGKANYLHSKDVETAKLMSRASCSLPILTDPVEVNEKLYLDGGIADSIPIQRALDKGYDKIVVVATRRKGSYSGIKKVELPVFERLYADYPKFLNTVKNRGAMYKEEIKQCEKLQKQKKVILIRPTAIEVGRLESDEDELKLAYYHGYTKAKEYVDKIKNW